MMKCKSINIVLILLLISTVSSRLDVSQKPKNIIYVLSISLICHIRQFQCMNLLVLIRFYQICSSRSCILLCIVWPIRKRNCNEDMAKKSKNIKHLRCQKDESRVINSKLYIIVSFKLIAKTRYFFVIKKIDNDHHDKNFVA